MIRIEVPMALPSRGNARYGHWAQRKKLVDAQAGPVLALLSQHRRPPFPVAVRLTRVAPRSLDRCEADAMSLKAVRDAVARWLGLDDDDDQIRWFYGQAVDGRPRYQAARIEIRHGHIDCACCGQPVFSEEA